MNIEPKDQHTVRSALLLMRVLLAEFVSTEVKKGELQNRALVRKAQRRLTAATRLLKQLQR